jgi:ADP-ribose pyrophosphatase YjhB (NUDIX family)
MSLDASVAVIENEEVLLVRRDDFKVWVLPGGRVEPGESVAEAAIREVYEETGIRVKLTRLVGIYAMPRWIDNSHRVVFTARPVGGVLQPQPGETTEAVYFRAEALPELLLWWHRQPIQDALGGVGGSAVWQQELYWPSDWMPPQEVVALRQQGPLPESLVRSSWELWCREPQPGEQWREIEEE